MICCIFDVIITYTHYTKYVFILGNSWGRVRSMRISFCLRATREHLSELPECVCVCCVCLCIHCNSYKPSMELAVCTLKSHLHVCSWVRVRLCVLWFLVWSFTIRFFFGGTLWRSMWNWKRFKISRMNISSFHVVFFIANT